MTLDKHQIDGVQSFGRTTVASSVFETALSAAGYTKAGSAPGQAGCVKIWWVHSTYRRVESIYSPNKEKVITAYHVQ